MELGLNQQPPVVNGLALFTDNGELDEDVPSWAPAEIHPAPVETFVLVHHIVEQEQGRVPVELEVDSGHIRRAVHPVLGPADVLRDLLLPLLLLLAITFPGSSSVVPWNRIPK